MGTLSRGRPGAKDGTRWAWEVAGEGALKLGGCLAAPFLCFPKHMFLRLLHARDVLLLQRQSSGKEVLR